MPDFEPRGLTAFIVGMIRTPTNKLLTADVKRLAAKYQVREDHAEFYIRMWCGGA